MAFFAFLPLEIDLNAQKYYFLNILRNNLALIHCRSKKAALKGQNNFKLDIIRTKNIDSRFDYFEHLIRRENNREEKIIEKDLRLEIENYFLLFRFNKLE